MLRLHAAEAVTTGHANSVMYKHMPRWHNNYPDGHAFFCTYSVQDWSPCLDNNAIPVLYDEWEKARQALGVRVLAYCVMPDHVHIVIWNELGENACKFLHRTIAQTSRRLKPGGGLWKERPRVILVYSRRVLNIKVDYVHNNPVRRGLVASPELWPHSSFCQLEFGDSSDG
ncbi:MAG: transposase, partial [Armatimonadota bacterium]